MTEEFSKDNPMVCYECNEFLKDSEDILIEHIHKKCDRHDRKEMFICCHHISEKCFDELPLNVFKAIMGERYTYPTQSCPSCVSKLIRIEEKKQIILKPLLKWDTEFKDRLQDRLSEVLMYIRQNEQNRFIESVITLKKLLLE